MTKLPVLRSRLNKLRRMRTTARLGTAWCGLAVALLWLAAAIFLLDWAFEPGRFERVLLLVIGGGALIWAFRRYTLPFMGQGESMLDMALLVERQHRIDSDLVAALQFESPEADRWGSRQLEDAVIDDVAESSRRLNVLEGFDRSQMFRRLSLATATLAVVVAAVVMFPAYAGAFAQRMLLSSIHYPTDTNVETILVNGSVVELLPYEQPTARCAYGQPLVLEVVCSGELPERGVAVLESESGLETEVELTRLANVPASAGNSASAATSDAATHQAVYRGEFSRVVDTLYCQFYVGDCWTEPAKLAVIPLPKIEFTMHDTPPAYARGGQEKEKLDSSPRQKSVIEGSSVELRLVCTNKELAEARFIVGEQSFDLKEVSQDDQGHNWTLPAKGTPLENITEPIDYRIEVVDTDGMSPARPIQGYIRIKTDRAPRIAGDVEIRKVVPEAKQTVTYRINDDYGVDGVNLHVRVVPGRRTGEDMVAEREEVLEVQPLGNPIMTGDLPSGGSFLLDVSRFGVEKGDQIVLTWEAIDYRGDRPGESSASEPITLLVTDRSGIFSDVSEADLKTLKQSDTILELLLGEEK